MITYTHTINSTSSSKVKPTHVNKSRSEPKVAGRTGSDTICNNPPCHANNLEAGAKFFFCLKRVRACRRTNTQTLRRHSTPSTQHTGGLPIQYHLKFKSNTLSLRSQINSNVLKSRTSQRIISSLTKTSQFVIKD